MSLLPVLLYSMSRPPVVTCLGDSLPGVSGDGGGAVILGGCGYGSVSRGVESGHYYGGNWVSDKAGDEVPGRRGVNRFIK